jgi:hypothetical protein
LDLIEDQQRADLIATCAQGLKKRRAEVKGPTDTLNRLDDDRGGAVRHLLCDGRVVAPGDETDVERRTRKAVPLRGCAPGDGARSRGATVERMLDGRYVRAARDREGHLERVFVRLRATVDEEHTVEVQAREPDQPLRGAHAHIQRHGVALKAQGPGLLGERPRPHRVTVTERCDRMATVEVEHATAIAGVQPDAFGADHGQRILREHRCEEIGQRART